MNVWLAVMPLPLVVSPQSQSYETMSLRSSVERAPLNAIDTPVVPVGGALMTATGGSTAKATDVMTGLTRRANAASSANADRPTCREAIAELLSLKYDNAVAPIPCYPLARRRALVLRS